MSLISELENIEASLTGSKATEEEVQQLVEQLPSSLTPSWLPALLQKFQLAEVCFSLGEDDDESKLGVDLQWFTINEMIGEALLIYPGKSVQ